MPPRPKVAGQAPSKYVVLTEWRKLGFYNRLAKPLILRLRLRHNFTAMPLIVRQHQQLLKLNARVQFPLPAPSWLSPNSVEFRKP